MKQKLQLKYDFTFFDGRTISKHSSISKFQINSQSGQIQNAYHFKISYHFTSEITEME